LPTAAEVFVNGVMAGSGVCENKAFLKGIADSGVCENKAFLKGVAGSGVYENRRLGVDTTRIRGIK